MRKIIAFVNAAYQWFVSFASKARSPLLLLVRLYWGGQFAQSGWGKLHHLDQVTQFFTSLGLPAAHGTALFVAMIEFVGGILFALGLGSRVTALVLFANMTVAYWAANPNAFAGIFSDPGRFYAAAPYTFWFASLLILVLGPGFFSLDILIGRWLNPPEYEY
jgi:putative oxidoreductase